MWRGGEPPGSDRAPGVTLVGGGATAHGETEAEKSLCLMRRKRGQQGKDEQSSDSGHERLPIWA